jgi:selenium-binding protein 1
MHASEEFLYVACSYDGNGGRRPDFLAVVDAESGAIVREAPMPNVGDELHCFGWNRCAPSRPSHLIVPGFRSSRVHVLDVAEDPRRPRLVRVIEPDELVRATGYTRPHAVHCLPGDEVAISMLGDVEGRGPGGFAVLDAATFELKGRWEGRGDPPPDAPGCRASHLHHVWDLAQLRLERTDDLGLHGRIPLAVRRLHDREAEEGFVNAALASTVWRWRGANGSCGVDPVITVDPLELDGWSLPVPGLIGDVVLSLDDGFLYVSNWLHGDVRRYDVSDPDRPVLTGQVWLGGVLGRPSDAGRALHGGPRALQLSLDGRRLYVTNSLYSSWDERFYPRLRAWLLRVDCDPEGGMEVDRGFFVDLHARPDGPARAGEAHLHGGDCTAEVLQ